MKPKKIFFSCIVIFLTFSLHAQDDPSWQWAQRGGSSATFEYGSQFRDWGMERIIDLAVDNNNNYYYLAEVAGYTFTLGDTEYQTYNDAAGERDLFIFSTDDQGNFRWNKIIGGGYDDFANSLGVDDNNNVYVSGTVYNLDGNTPVHFDNDSIMEEGTSEPGPNNKKVYIIKYDNDGNFQWLRQPEGEEVPSGVSGGIVKTVVEPNGNTHSLVWFGEGTHLNGQLTVEQGMFKAVIVNYDENGSLLNFIPLDMKPEFTSFYKYQLAYDANLDRYYIADTYRNGDGTLGIGSYGSDTNAFYLAAVNNQGEVLWYHQDQIREFYTTGELKLDNEGNIYFSGYFGTLYADNPNSFAGYEFETPEGTSGIQAPFLVKLDPDGNLIWGTNAQLYSPFNGQSIVVDDDNVYLGLGMLHNTWGDIDIPGFANQGLIPDIAIMRFDAQTGEAQEVMRDQNTSSQDAIMAMALDNNRDLVVGGYFGSDLFYGTDLHLNDNAPDSDFFIAKYQTEFLGVESQNLQIIKVYPNPTTGLLTLQSETGLESYKLFDLRGRIVQKGSLETNQVDLSGIENGLYILRVQELNGGVQNLKVVKE